jgi:DNA modification methylase
MRTEKTHFVHIAITKDAFPRDTELFLNGYIEYCENVGDFNLKTFLRFIGFTILEEISYTRKDGQYLRWDHRSDRALSGASFDKGKIHSFEEALSNKLFQIEEDILFPSSSLPFQVADGSENNELSIHLDIGSCLEELPKYEDNFFDFTITSPPYCNRYDYTRTYALELVYLGCKEEEVRRLRQEMLSCTVENKEKLAHLEQIYRSVGKTEDFTNALGAYESSDAMSEINIVLNKLKDSDQLNNKNIARMVKNYFLEMCFVISELARVTRPNGYCVMVNDNVRYGGEEIPVDLILSEFAENFGFFTEKIFVLPRGKGNSSQQMGAHGRTETRKCVYLWRKR